MSEAITIQVPNGDKISAVIGRPNERLTKIADKTLIIMIHGYPSTKDNHNNLFGGVADLLVAQGLQTVRFDFRGCGQSEGAKDAFTVETATDDLQNILKWARAQGYSRFGIIAEGLGASLAFANIDPSMSFIILAWPILDPAKVYETLLEEDIKKAGGSNVTAENAKIVTSKFMESLRDWNFSESIEKADVPLLVFHGLQDKLVPITQLELLRTHFKGPRADITTFDDGGHGLIDIPHRRMMHYHIKNFADRYALI